MSGILQAVNFAGRFDKKLRKGEKIRVRSDYYTPGYIAVLTAHLKRISVSREGLEFVDAKNAGYFSAMGLSKALWGLDDYDRPRIKEGYNYAPLTHLDSRDAVDHATAKINSCLRTMAAQSRADYRQSPGFKSLMDVVGELHDNVWSHGMDRGFSAAQRRGGPKKGIIEFALADTGLGFLGELKGSGIARKYGIDTDQEAMNWCIQEGNSSKLDHMQDDGWGQSLPDDFVGSSPFGQSVPTIHQNNGNHHQGLGLAKLISLAKTYEAELIIVSGYAVLHLSRGRMRFAESRTSWKGVAISLTLQESKMATLQDAAPCAAVDDIMNLLRG